MDPPLKTSSAAGCRQPRPRSSGTESRWPSKTYYDDNNKKRAWVVFMVLLGLLLPPPSSAQQDFEHLHATVESHTQSLLNMSRYLRQTDKFWKWYQANHKGLNDLLAGGGPASTRPQEATPSDPLLLQLQKKIDNMQDKYEKRLAIQEEEMKSLREEVVNINHHLNDQSTQTNTLQTQIQEQQDKLQECQASVTKLEQVGQNRNNILMFVKNLALKVNMTIDAFKEDMHAKIEELHDAQSLPLAEELNIINGTVQAQKVEIQQLKQTSSRQGAKIRKAVNDRRKLDSKYQTAALKTDVDEVKGEMDEVQVETQKMDGQLITLRQDMDDLLDQNVSSKLDGVVMDMIFPLVGNVEALTKNMSHMKDSELDIDQRLSDLEAQIRSVNSKVSSKSQTNSQEIQTQVTKLQTDVARLDGNFASLDPLRNQAKTLIKHVADSRNDIRTIQSNIQKLQDQSGDMNLKHLHLENIMLAKITELEGRMPQGTNALRRTPNTSPIDYVNSVPGVSGSVDSYTGRRGSPGNLGNRGPPGNAGSMGTPGIPGSPGLTGDPGNRGSSGLSGYAGASGSTGLQGPAGPPGPSGNSGVIGSQGTTGRQGSPGRRGRTGEPGIPGGYGSRGNRGPAGRPGPAG